MSILSVCVLFCVSVHPYSYFFLSVLFCTPAYKFVYHVIWFDRSGSSWPRCRARGKNWATRQL